MHRFTSTVIAGLALWLLSACGKEATGAAGGTSAPPAAETGESGETHDDQEEAAGGGDHGHEEESIGTATVGDLELTLSQAHGGVEAGHESHLIVKLPYSDQGSSIVRAWIGTEDRTASMVGKGEYDADHDRYDVHATGPDPLPDGVQWWIEVEKPDGTKQLGSAQPLMH